MKKLQKKLHVAHPKEYAIRVQSLVRQLKPPAKTPHMMRICLIDDLHMVKSVGWAEFHASKDGHHRSSFHLLATHLLYTRLGLGQAMHDHVVENLIIQAQDMERFESLIITALVHRDNTECKSLLTLKQWSYARMHADEIHEEWNLVIGVDE